MTNDQLRMYGDLAWTWPIISKRDDYIEEAEGFIETIRDFSEEEPRTLLHLGCGGGHLDYTLKRSLKVTGIDISEDMLALAQQLNPEVSYLTGDMRTLRLDRTFDAVMAADSVSYMLTEADLAAAFRTAFDHLRPGGVFCTYAEVTRETFRQNRTETFGGSAKDLEIVVIENRYDPDISDTHYEYAFVYLIRRQGRLQIENDLHLCGLFPVETWRRLLEETGFEVYESAMDEEGASSEASLPMFACVRP